PGQRGAAERRACNEHLYPAAIIWLRVRRAEETVTQAGLCPASLQVFTLFLDVRNGDNRAFGTSMKQRQNQELQSRRELRFGGG
ncbi:MAG: hypothetical protein ACP5MD_07540, partial [Verrucomicrobiia bacterium]